LLTILAVVLSVPGQRTAGKSLVLSASVVKIGSTCIDGTPVARIQLYIQFRNDRDSTVLILPPELFFERRVRFANDASGDTQGGTVAVNSLLYDPYLDNPFGPRTRDDYDAVSGYVGKLKAGNTRFKQIEPGKYYEFQDVIWLKHGFRLEASSAKGQGRCKDDNLIPEPEYSSFELEYHFSAKKYEGETDLLKDLRDRWKPFGDLLLDTNGDISYKSEKILTSSP
jgi:hypothetical protein